MIKGILFDFDGTLATNLDLPDMRRQVIQLTQTTAVPDEIYRDQYIVEIIDRSTAWLEQREPEAAGAYHKQAHALITRIELDAAARTQPFPEVREYLAALQARKVHSAVVTRNCREAVLLTFPDLLEHVDLLFARDDVDHLKPDPRHLQQALDALDLAPAQTAMMGDGQLDMQTGRSLQMLCVGVLSGSSNADQLTQAGADLVVERFNSYQLD